MVLHNYRRVLAMPGVRALLPLMFAARIPVGAVSMALTLHVVLSLRHGYGAAGLVGAAGTIGIAVGAPLMGRIVDSSGLRRMLVITTIGDGAFWLLGWQLPYPALIIAAFVSGVLSLPVMSIGRQAMAAAVPEDHRRTALSLDSMSVEMSWMIGPSLAVLVSTKASTSAAMIMVGCLLVASGVALYVVNPSVRGESDAAPDAPRPTRRQWMTPSLLATLAGVSGAIFAIAGTEVAVVAGLRHGGQLGWSGVVVIAMCLASLLGGLVYGSVQHSPRPLVLMGLLGLFVIPVGLAGDTWWALALAVVPSNVLCAPVIASTADEVTRLAPGSARGEAMGLHSSALTVGAALGSPLTGAAVDHFGPAGGFALAGTGGLLFVAVAWPLAHRRPSRGVEPLPDRVPVD